MSPCRSRSAPGDAVVGATVNAGGRLVVRATRVGADTQLAQMARLVEEAQTGKAAVQRLADRISAVFVPIVIALAVGTFGVLAGRRRRCDGRVHRGGRGADHRLPVRAGPGDADRAAGRHRPRRPARHPDQGPGGAGVHPPGRHRRAGQDRHRHHRQDVAGRRSRRRCRRRGRGAAPRRVRWRTLRSTPSPGRQRRGAARTCPAVTDFAPSKGSASKASSRAARVLVGRASLLARPVVAIDDGTRRRRRPIAEDEGQTAVVGGLGRAGPRACWPWPTP